MAWSAGGILRYVSVLASNAHPLRLGVRHQFTGDTGALPTDKNESNSTAMGLESDWAIPTRARRR